MDVDGEATPGLADDVATNIIIRPETNEGRGITFKN